MAATALGIYDWGVSRSREGHRVYTLHTKVKCSASDGPQAIMNASGLPAVGSFWAYANDVDLWAICEPTLKAEPYQKKEGEPATVWIVTQTFSTLPRKRCQDENIDDPLLEPMGISGSFSKFTKEAAKDKDGDMILSSTNEPLRGSAVEFDHNRPTVKIQQNVASLGLDTFSEMVDTVNDSTLWGMDSRCVKLSNAPWERKLYGLCNYYYTRTFEFEIDSNTFDREVGDEGSKAKGKWNADYSAFEFKDDFYQFTDRQGNPMRTMLRGDGKPLGIADDGSLQVEDPGDVKLIEVQYYEESNFLLLGIPTVL